LSKVTEVVADYVAEVSKHAAVDSSREHSYRPAQATLFEGLAEVHVVNDGAQSGGNMPDFVFLSKTNTDIPLAYGEAKDLGTKLDPVEKSEQLTRYGAYENLLLTNATEFRFYRAGERYRTVHVATLDHDGCVVPLPENYQALADEFANLVSRPTVAVRSAPRLAEIMAAKARRIHNMASQILDSGEDSEDLLKVYLLVQKMLIPDLSHEDFVDMYAQTIVYGLFTARFYDETPETFSRYEALGLLGKTTPFLREFFGHVAGVNFDRRLTFPVDELCEVLRISDIHNIINRYLDREGAGDRGKDPILHFYEDFLRAFDRDTKKKRGVFYTPAPLAQYMVRGVDRILKDDFGLTRGLADATKQRVKLKAPQKGPKTKQEVLMHRVQIFDPAVGTGTFLNEVIKFVEKTFESQPGRWPTYVANDLVPRLQGFELMMAPYTIAHMKLGLTLLRSNAEIPERLRIYLTNTLEKAAELDHDLFTVGLAEALNEESIKASEIKSERPIMVVLGNPPWSGESSNKSDHANAFVDRYKVEPGADWNQPLQERNPKWLNDDYVKFTSFAHELIQRNKEGVLAFVTNNGYLENPTFRGMRGRLARDFDKLYVLDLHGSSLKKELTPDGRKDENVFNIRNGAAVIFAVKTSESKRPADVFVADLYGSRQEKFDQLEGEIDWTKITLDKRTYRFKPAYSNDTKTYDTGVSLQELFNVTSTGIVTARDNFTISPDPDELWDRMQRFVQMDVEAARQEFNLRRDVVDWTVQGAKDDVFINYGSQHITRIAYRPLDYRWTYYTGRARGLLCRPRDEVSQHFIGHENWAIGYGRTAKDGDFSAVVVVNAPMEAKCAESSTQSKMAPLWLYTPDGQRHRNFNETELKKLLPPAVFQQTPDDLSILDYCYGVLSDPQYRTEYAELLVVDFPRVKIPSSIEEFEDYRDFGRRLRLLHTLDASANLDTFQFGFPVGGHNRIATPKWQDERVYLNTEQYISGVPEDVWNYRIGGYFPAHRWLRDRKGRELSDRELDEYLQVLAAILEATKLISARAG